MEAYTHSSCANTNTRRDSRVCQCDSNLPLISVCFHLDQYLSHCGSHCYLPGATLFSPPVPPFGSVQLHHIRLHKRVSSCIRHDRDVPSVSLISGMVVCSNLMPELDFKLNSQYKTWRMKKSMLKLKAIGVFTLKCVGFPSSSFTE